MGWQGSQRGDTSFRDEYTQMSQPISHRQLKFQRHGTILHQLAYAIQKHNQDQHRDACISIRCICKLDFLLRNAGPLIQLIGNTSYEISNTKRHCARWSTPRCSSCCPSWQTFNNEPKQHANCDGIVQLTGQNRIVSSELAMNFGN